MKPEENTEEREQPCRQAPPELRDWFAVAGDLDDFLFFDQPEWGPSTR